jgi:RimJ/RimL family protein N-acetyltransferase
MTTIDMIELLNITENDFKFLYKILEERESVQNISHKKIPTYNEHINFIKSNPYSNWYIIFQNNKKIGTVYLSKQDEVGVFIKKEFQKNGIGKKSLKKLIKKNSRKKFFANVNPKNYNSIKFFENFGFKLIQETHEMNSYEWVSNE